MKILRLKLENFANIYTAMKKTKIDIDFTKAKNNILIFIGPNGSGKTSIMSELNPFATLGSCDIRSDINLIMENKDGYKEIHILDNNKLFVIKHYYLYSKKNKSIKSFISLDGEELNPNGNVTSFKEIIKAYMGLDIDFMHIMRLGSNINGLIDMKASERKNYAGHLFEEIGVYSTLFKKVSEKFRLTKSLLKSVNEKISKLNIVDINVLKNENTIKQQRVTNLNNEKNKIIAKLAIIKNDISEKRIFLDNSDIVNKTKLFNEYNNILKSNDIVYIGNINDTIKDINNRIVDIEKELSILHCKNDANYILLDTLMKNKNEFEKIRDDCNTKDRIDNICDLLDKLKCDILQYKVTEKPDRSKDDYLYLLSILQTLNDMIISIKEYGDKILKDIIILMNKGTDPITYAEKHIRNLNRSIDETKIKISSIENVKRNQMDIVYQLCEENECPYKIFYNKSLNTTDNMSELLSSIENDKNKISYYELFPNIYKSLKILHNYMNTNSKYLKILPHLNFKFIIDCIVNNKKIYNEIDIINKINEVEEYDKYIELKTEIDKLESTLATLKESTVDIKSLNKKIDTVYNNIVEVESSIQYDTNLISEYNKKKTHYVNLLNNYTKLYEVEKDYENLKNDVEYCYRLQHELKVCEDEYNMYNDKLSKIQFDIDTLSNEINENNINVSNYEMFTNEKKELEIEYNDIEILRMALSPNTGLPLLYLQIYLNKCIMVINNLLNIAYEDLEISDFIIDDKVFKIPYIKNGVKIPDIRYASQGERSFLSIALSLALIIQNLDKYNIMLLDEVDATLDITNRTHFISVIEKLMSVTNAEQLFMISHNNMFDNYPVDVIVTGETNIDNFKNINIVYSV